MSTQPESSQPQVRVTQVWADADPRSEGRHVVVQEVADGKAVVLPCDKDGRVTGTRRTAIRVDRMGDGSNRGYRLVRDADRKDS